MEDLKISFLQDLPSEKKYTYEMLRKNKCFRLKSRFSIFGAECQISEEIPLIKSEVLCSPDVVEHVRIYSLC